MSLKYFVKYFIYKLLTKILITDQSYNCKLLIGSNTIVILEIFVEFGRSHIIEDSNIK